MCACMKGMVRASASAAREQRVGHENATGLCAIDVLLLTLNCAKNEVDWMEAMDSIFLNQESGFVAVIFLPASEKARNLHGQLRGRGEGAGRESAGNAEARESFVSWASST